MWFLLVKTSFYYFFFCYLGLLEKKNKKIQYIYPKSKPENEIGLKNIFFFCLRVSWFSFFTVCETAR